jgi:hypothetical protein
MSAERFGVEIEVNLPEDEVPVRGATGIHKVAEKLRGAGMEAEVSQWQYTNDNRSWVCKPDSSCGLEVCSPVLRRDEVGEVLRAVEALKPFSLDHRCSFHVHVDVKDLIPAELCSVLAWWVKCEHVFLDFAVPLRKSNKYCRCIGATDLFSISDEVSLDHLVRRLGNKYLSLNTFHMVEGRRKSVEFRLGEAADNADFVENWISLVLRFVDASVSSLPPDDYGWLDPEDIFEFMEFDRLGLKNLRSWFLNRLIRNCEFGKGMWSPSSRHHVLQKYISMRSFG